MNKKRIVNILKTLAWPVVSFLITEILVLVSKDRHLFTSVLDIKTLIRETGVSAMIAFALSLNLKSGRFDLSLGAQKLAGTIIGGLLALRLGLSGLWLLLFSIVFGLFFGFLTGAIFITLRVPPMVLGIGLGLILECVPYVISGGKGLNLFGYGGTEIINNTAVTIILMCIVGLFVYVLMNLTRFGYQNKAVNGSQLIAKNSGIDIFKNALLCYTFAGALVCLSGMIDASYTTQMNATMGFGSSGGISANMFPMLLGGFIGLWSNDAIGVIVASLSVKIFNYGLTMMEFSEPASSVINMVIFIVFLVFLSNKSFFSIKKAEKTRIEKAIARKRELGIDA